MVPACRKALEGNPPAEVRRRLEPLLEKLAREARELPPGQRRGLRALEVLERIGTPEARALVQQLAAGAADARLTLEAQAALKRMAK